MFKKSLIVLEATQMKHLCVYLLALVVLLPHAHSFEYSWQLDDTPQGQETATVVQPIVVNILDEQVTLSDSSASIALLKHYSVHLDENWTAEHAHALLQTFQSIPQYKNHLGDAERVLPDSLWHITDRHIHNDIAIEHHGDTRIVNVAADAFTYANPLLAEIEGVQGRYFSKRLHRAVVRFVTADGTDLNAVRRILRDRYDVSIAVPDYAELTKHTTGEHAGRFAQFKSEELITLLTMLEEFPQGMLKTPGLKYLVRRLDGTPHPRYPTAPAVAWTSAGYIEFMESAFKAGNIDYTHRLVLHEKAHFLWSHLFDDQLKADWIELGGWYENPDDPDGWSTTKQTEFVSAYAHGINPNEDMAESISFYIVRPDLLRSRSPAKYEFIQNRIMHGTKYISQIREDLTFEVYNLYPDYVYPGRIVRVDIDVQGEPTEDKQIIVEIEIHSESDLDTAHSAYARVFSEKGTYFEVGLYPVNDNGVRIIAGHILRSYPIILSKYAAQGYWSPDRISIRDGNNNQRHNGIADFGWSLYIDNPMADCDPPQYVPNTMKLSLSQGDENGRPYQIVTAKWKLIEASGIKDICANLNDKDNDTYSRFDYGHYNEQTGEASVDIKITDYMPSGIYELNRICMVDIAGNGLNVYFTHPWLSQARRPKDLILDEQPQTIEVQTKNPDTTPPELDINDITITAEPTRPDDPNGETHVYITFRTKDNISGYNHAELFLRDPQGHMHRFTHWISNRAYHALYFVGDPTVWQTYEKTILLPVGSNPGTWGLAQMVVLDKAGNRNIYDFTEIVRFTVTDSPTATKTDINADGQVNILDLVFVANAFGTDNAEADVNNDGEVNILDLVAVASDM